MSEATQAARVATDHEARDKNAVADEMEDDIAHARPSEEMSAAGKAGAGAEDEATATITGAAMIEDRPKAHAAAQARANHPPTSHGPRPKPSKRILLKRRSPRM